MNKFLAIILSVSLLAGCGSLSQIKPAIVYQTQEVNMPVVVFPDAPVVEQFDSRVKKLTDTSPDGEVAQAYKQDLLTLILRDKIFVDFLNEYRKAKQKAQTATK
jgi:hypothetical protein